MRQLNALQKILHLLKHLIIGTELAKKLKHYLKTAICIAAVTVSTVISISGLTMALVNSTKDDTTAEVTQQSSTPVATQAPSVPESTIDPITEISDTTERYVLTEDIPLAFEYQRAMQDACEKYNVPYALALAVAECESSFNLEADSGTCWGVMQIHPINYPRLRENGIEPTEYEGNITAGVFMLGELLDKYADTHKALMAYNCGETGAKRLWNQGYFTSKYSRKVVEKYEKWQEIINNNLEA